MDSGSSSSEAEKQPSLAEEEHAACKATGTRGTIAPAEAGQKEGRTVA